MLCYYVGFESIHSLHDLREQVLHLNFGKSCFVLWFVFKLGIVFAFFGLALVLPKSLVVGLVLSLIKFLLTRSSK